MVISTLTGWLFFGLTPNSITQKVDSRVYLVPITVGYLSDMDRYDGAAIDSPMRAPSASSLKGMPSIADVENCYRTCAMDVAV